MPAGQHFVSCLPGLLAKVQIMRHSRLCCGQLLEDPMGDEVGISFDCAVGHSLVKPCQALQTCMQSTFLCSLFLCLIHTCTQPERLCLEIPAHTVAEGTSSPPEPTRTALRAILARCRCCPLGDRPADGKQSFMPKLGQMSKPRRGKALSAGGFLTYRRCGRARRSQTVALSSPVDQYLITTQINSCRKSLATS